MPGIAINIFLMVFFTGILSAQQQSERAQKAKEILDKFSARAKEYTSFKTSFTFLQMGYDEEISYSYKGKLYLEGEKYKMDLPQSTIFSNGETVWQYLSDVNEVTITHKQDDGSLMSDPREIFTFYKKDFKYMYRETQTYNGDEIAVIDLFPEDIEASDYSRIRVKINMEEMIIHSIKYFGKGGVHYRVDIKDFKTDTTYSEGFFTFSKANYEGVEVIDMR